MNAKEMADKNREWIIQHGDQLQQQQQQYGQQQGGLAESYRGQANAAYAPLIAGQGGYTPEEKAGMVTTPEELAGNYLTPDEQNQVRGDVWKPWSAYDPGGLMGSQYESEARQRAATGDLSNTAWDTAGKLQTTAGDYANWGGATLGDTRNRIEGDIQKDELTLDPNLAGNYLMTPGQQQDIVTKAGISAGTGYRAATGELSRRSAAAGIDPAAAATARLRLENAGAGAGADAMTSARIGASREAADRAMNLEQARLGANRGYAGMKSQADLALSGQTLGEQETAANLGMRAAEQGGAAKERALNTSLSAEQGMNDTRYRTQKGNQDTAIGLLGDIENKEAGRAAAVAGNRQQTARANQAQQFGQGQTVAEARRQESAEGRGYLTGEQGLASANQNQAMNRQAGIYGTEGGLANQAAGVKATADQNPAWWQKVIGGAAGFLGGFFDEGGVVTEPTQAILGEKGPEMVIPLNGSPNNKVQAPSFYGGGADRLKSITAAGPNFQGSQLPPSYSSSANSNTLASSAPASPWRRAAAGIAGGLAGAAGYPLSQNVTNRIRGGRGGNPSLMNSTAPLKPVNYTDYRSRAIAGKIGRPRLNPALQVA